MARTISRRRSVRSTRSKRTKIVGGMNWKAPLIALIVAAATLGSSEGRASIPTEQQQREEIIRENNVKDAFTKALGGIEVEKTTVHGIVVKPDSIPKLKEFLKENRLDRKISVKDNGIVKPTGWSLETNFIRLARILEL